MKKLIILVLAIVFALPLNAQSRSMSGSVIIIDSEKVSLLAQAYSSDGMTIVPPDSLRVITSLEGAVKFSQWYDATDAEMSIVGNQILFSDTFSDIDGTGGNGNYIVAFSGYSDTAGFWDWNALYVQTYPDILDKIYNIRDTVNAVIDSLQSQDGWVAPTSLLGDSARAAVGDSVPVFIGDSAYVLLPDLGDSIRTAIKADCLKPNTVYNSDYTTLHFSSPNNSNLDSVISIFYPYARGSYDDAAIIADTLYPVDTITTWWADAHNNIADSSQAFGTLSFDSLTVYDCINVVFYKGVTADVADALIFDQVYCGLQADSVAALMTANLFPLSEAIDSIAQRFGSGSVQLHYVCIFDSSSWGGGSLSPVPAINLTFLNSAGKYFTKGQTNADGSFSFGGFVGSYMVVPAAYNYEFMDTSYSSAAVFYDTISTGEYNDTLFILATQRNPAAPYVRIAGNIENFGYPISGARIYYGLEGKGGIYDSSGGQETFVSKETNFKRSDEYGEFYFDVYAPEVLFDNNGNHPTYSVTIVASDGTLILPKQSISPSSSYIGTTVNLKTLVE